MTTQGEVKILDFGLAKRLSQGVGEEGLTGDSTTGEVPLTSRGVPAGSLEYMSPEQARGEALDARTDLFSFGAVLYEIATGRQAFAGDTPGVVFDAILNRSPNPPSCLNPELPLDLERIINKALEKDREVRYQHASDLRADLKRLKRVCDLCYTVDGQFQLSLNHLVHLLLGVRVFMDPGSLRKVARREGHVRGMDIAAAAPRKALDGAKLCRIHERHSHVPH